MDLPQPPPSGKFWLHHICTVPVPLNAQSSPIEAHRTPGGGERPQNAPDDDELLVELDEALVLDEELLLDPEVELLLVEDEPELLEDEVLEELELDEFELLEELLLLVVSDTPVQAGGARLPSWLP